MDKADHLGQSALVLVDIVELDTTDPQLVHFTCHGGAGAAIWRGAVPASVRTYHVEINAERPLRWASPGTLTDDSVRSCRLDGFLEFIDDDLRLVVRIGGGLLRGELAEGESSAEDGTRIQLVNVELTLWPYDLGATPPSSEGSRWQRAYDASITELRTREQGGREEPGGQAL